MMARYATGKETCETLIHAAGELAAEVGFANVSTRAVAERADENIGSIHYHFGGKEKLFEAVVGAVSQRWKEHSIAAVLEALEGELDRPEGQARAIRAVVHHQIALLFDRKHPIWHSRVIHQAMQRDSPLQKLVLRELIEPNQDAILRLIQRVRPELSYEETHVHLNVIMMPLVLHADYRPSVLQSLGEGQRYSEAYLQILEDVIVRQTQFSLGLPTDKPFQAERE